MQDTGNLCIIVGLIYKFFFSYLVRKEYREWK